LKVLTSHLHVLSIQWEETLATACSAMSNPNSLLSQKLCHYYLNQRCTHTEWHIHEVHTLNGLLLSLDLLKAFESQL